MPARHHYLPILLVLLTGCFSGSSSPAPPVEPIEPVPAVPEWQTSADAEESLAELTEAIFDAFDASTAVEPLIYPRGWVKRKVDPLSIQHEVVRRESDGQPSETNVRLAFVRKHTMIHPDHAAAEADEELLPYPPGPSRERMVDNPLYRAYEPTELTIIYRWNGTTWQRYDWTSHPEVGQAKDWLDRLNVP